MSDKLIKAIAWLILIATLCILVTLLRVANDLDHIRRQQCYTPVIEHGKRVLLYSDGCR